MPLFRWRGTLLHATIALPSSLLAHKVKAGYSRISFPSRQLLSGSGNAETISVSILKEKRTSSHTRPVCPVRVVSCRRDFLYTARHPPYSLPGSVPIYFVIAPLSPDPVAPAYTSDLGDPTWLHCSSWMTKR